MNTHLLLFLDIGGSEIFIIVLFVVMFFGSKKIPELARGLGKGIKELKNATNDIQQEIRQNVKDITNIKDSIDVKKQVKDLIKNETIDNKDLTNEKNTSKTTTKNDDEKVTKTNNTAPEDTVNESTSNNPANTISRENTITTPQQTKNN